MRTHSSETASGLFSNSLEKEAEAAADPVKAEDLFSDMILKALDDPDAIGDLPEDFEEIRDVLEAAVLHAKADDSPEVRACVSKKIPIIIEDHPEWDRKQQIAVAFSMCRKDPKAYEKAVADEEAEISRLEEDLGAAEAAGDGIAVAGIRYALGMAEAARDIAEQEASAKGLTAQERARFGSKGMGTKKVDKAGAPTAAIRAAAQQFEEEKHPRAKGGKFAPKGSGQAQGASAEAQPSAKKPAAEAPPQQPGAPAAQPTSPAGRLQQVDMDRVKGAVESARQALAARVQEGIKQPTPPKSEAGEQTMRPGAPGYEQFQEEARAVREETGGKKSEPKKPKSEAPQAERGAKPPYKNLAEFKDTMKRATSAGIKHDKIKEFMQMPRERREKLLQMAEGRKGTGTKAYKPKVESEKKSEPKAEVKPSEKPESKPEKPKEKPKAGVPEKEPKKKSEPKQERRPPSPAQEAARYEEEERKKKAKAGKKDEPSATQAARRAVAQRRAKGERGEIARPAGYKHDENPVAIIERSIAEMIKASEKVVTVESDVDTLKEISGSLVSKFGW